MDAARLGVKLARKAVAEGGRTDSCVVGFSISDEINSTDRLATIDLLQHALEDEPPDLILLETMTLVRDPETYEYLMQLSIAGQQETTRLLTEAGLQAKVLDFTFFPFGTVFDQNRAQITRVEESSDAYHLRFGSEDVDGRLPPRSAMIDDGMRACSRPTRYRVPSRMISWRRAPGAAERQGS